MFDNSRMPIDCPQCGYRLVETVRRLKTSPDLTCSGCGVVIRLDSRDFARGLDKADKAVADFERGIKRLFRN